jgi:hypothetical protein
VDGRLPTGADLGPPVARGQKSVTGSLLATGSDNDANIYSKFRIFSVIPSSRPSAGIGLPMRTDGDAVTTTIMGNWPEPCNVEDIAYRSPRDALLPLVP